MPVPASIMNEMADYYRARAPEFDDWFYRRGRYSLGAEGDACWFAEVAEVFVALDALKIEGDILELAAGTGIWTERLARTARSITAIDVSAEVLAINRAKVASDCVSYVLADLFTWQPDRTFDAVVFGYWLSHVPYEHLDAFLSTCTMALRPSGTIFFADAPRSRESTAAHLQVAAANPQVVIRSLDDGRSFQIVKNCYEPAELTERCVRAGLDVTVRQTSTHFIYGMGTRRQSPLVAADSPLP